MASLTPPPSVPPPVAPVTVSLNNTNGGWLGRLLGIGPINPALPTALPPRAARYYPYPVMVEEGKTYYWCSCGHSAKQPFCDGSHAKVYPGGEYKAIPWRATKRETIQFCGCKQSATAPTCNKAHARVATRKYRGAVLLPLITTIGVVGGAVIYATNFDSSFAERREEHARKSAEIMAQKDMIRRTQLRKEQEQLQRMTQQRMTPSPATPASSSSNNNGPPRAS